MEEEEEKNNQISETENREGRAKEVFIVFGELRNQTRWR